MKTLILLLFIFFITVQTKAETSSVSLDTYKADLKKVEQSIKITQSKIESAKAFAFLPDLYFSLAGLYLDKAAIAYLITQIKSKAKTPDEIDFSEAKKIRLEAIDIYKNIENRFPNYQLLDKVLFFMAHEYRDLGDMEQAKTTHKKIVDNFKQSKYWEESQLNLSNVFFDKKDFEFALAQYKKIIERPPTPVTLLAYHKMGWCYVNTAQWLKALDAFSHVFKDRLVFSKDQTPAEFAKMDVREEALVASVWPFTELDSKTLYTHPEFLNTLKYYREASFDKGSYRRVLARLGRRLVLKKRNPEAAEVFFELLRLSDDSTIKREALEDYFTAMKTAKIDYYPKDVSQEVAAALKLISEGDSKNNIEKYEPLLRDVATYRHKTAMATKKSEDFERALESYKDYFWIYPSSRYLGEMNMNFAEVYYFLDKKVESAYVYLKLSTGYKSKKKKKDFLSSAIQAFIEAFKDENKLTLLERNQGRNGLRNAGALFVQNYPKDAGRPAIEFNIAKSFYDERIFQKAIPELRKFIQTYPRNENTGRAALLLLDSFYLQDKSSLLIGEGRSLTNNPRLSAEIKASVSAIIKQAQLKNVKSLAGDFGTNKYVSQFLQFAKSNKGSDLGETALFEAFTASKAKSDYEAFSIGESFMATYPQSPKAKDLLNTLIQMALSISDFPKAAFYLQSFYVRFPQDASHNDYGKQALSIYEQLFENDKLASFALELKNFEKAAKAYYNMQNWKQLNSIAAQVSGVPGLYYQGLSLWRLGQKSAALGLLSRAANEIDNSEEAKAMSAHAGFIVAQESYNQFRNFAANATISTDILKQKLALYQELDRSLQRIVGMGVGRWTLGALYLLGQLNLNFANFLANGRAPAGLSSDQFKKAIQPQINSYRQNASLFFENCLKSANQFEVLTHFTKACAGDGRAEVNEASESFDFYNRIGAPSSSDVQFKTGLFRNPKDKVILKKWIDSKLKSEDYSFAFLLEQQLSELEPSDHSPRLEMGMILMKMKMYEDALNWFQAMLKSGPLKPGMTPIIDKKAYWGLAALYRNFSLTAKYRESLVEAKKQGQLKGYLHPWVREL